MLNIVKQPICRHSGSKSAWRQSMCALALAGVAWVCAPAVWAQPGFTSPQAAATALADAVRADNQPALRALLGRHGSKLISSGDPVADARNRETFIQAYGESNKIVLEGEEQAELWVGKEGWPLPIPIVRSSVGSWRFDTRRGEVEILSRRMGRNELAAIQVCLAVVDAEREFATRDSDGDGLREYAARFTSTPGQRNGLYWPTEPQEALSPLGPLLAAAAKDGYMGTGAGSSEPYQGYFYKILTRQGKEAAGGAYSYFVQAQMIAGFALIAYPARYGASGIMSFIVNQDGIVYQKNLGHNTATIATGLKSYNPDASWKRVREIK